MYVTLFYFIQNNSSHLSLSLDGEQFRFVSTAEYFIVHLLSLTIVFKSDEDNVSRSLDDKWVKQCEKREKKEIRKGFDTSVDLKGRQILPRRHEVCVS